MSQSSSFSTPCNPTSASLVSLLEGGLPKASASQNTARRNRSPMELRQHLNTIIGSALDIINDDLDSDSESDDDFSKDMSDVTARVRRLQ
jgi:hypothetical protein